MTLVQSVKTCFEKYATFSERAARPEYWKFWLFWLIVMIVLTLINSLLFGPTLDVERQVVIAQDGTQSIEQTENLRYNSGVLGNVFCLAVLCSGLAVASRRLHDIGRSGWWQIMPFAAIVITVPLFILATVGWTDAVAALRVTGNIKVQTGGAGALVVFALLGTFIPLLVWLCKPSQPGANAYGPNQREVAQ